MVEYRQEVNSRVCRCKENLGRNYSPTDEWTAQQLREATPWGEGPRFLIRDNDNT